MVAEIRKNLAGARGVLGAVPPTVDQSALVAYMANYGDLYWVLDDEQQQLLLRLSAAPFGNNRADWALALAEAHHLRGHIAKARVYADSARAAFEDQLRDAPENRRTSPRAQPQKAFPNASRRGCR
jgi:hypothetical protein